MSAPRIPKHIERAAVAEGSRLDCFVAFIAASKHPFIMRVTRAGETRSVAVSDKLIRSEFNIDWIKRDVRRLERQLPRGV